MAQPTETPEHFEVSEPTAALPVPALSRYARPATEPETAPGESMAELGTDASSTSQTTQAATGPRPLDPIVQPASAEWATDPSPPQPVGGSRDASVPGAATDESATPNASSHSPAHTPAIHEAQPRAEQSGRKRPFWKRLAMARPGAEPAQTAPELHIPPDLLKPAIERIDHLTRRFEREQKVLQQRLDDFEHNLTRLWELEESMGLEEVRAQLAVMRADQEEIADGLHAIAKRVTIGASAIVAVFSAILIWLVI